MVLPSGSTIFVISIIVVMVTIIVLSSVEETYALGKKFEKGLLYGYLLAKINQATNQSPHV